MATYPISLRPSFSYEDHLMYNAYVGDLNEGLTRAANTVSAAQVLSAAAVSAEMKRNSQFLSNTVSAEVRGVRGDLASVNETLRVGLSSVTDGLSGLQAEFEIGMGQVLLQFEMTRSVMKEGFQRIEELLKNRRKVSAQEHFSDALQFYKDGCRFRNRPQWFSDALRHFRASVAEFERNPLAHLHIGHILHYEQGFRNLGEALRHYELCFTYAEATDGSAAVAAQGYFYAGWLKAAHLQSYLEAIALTTHALSLDPTLAEAEYHLAKYCALMGDGRKAADHLRRAIENFDRRYALKCEADPDFSGVRSEVHKCLCQLLDDAKATYARISCGIDRKTPGFQNPLHAHLVSELSEKTGRMEKLAGRGTYFDVLDAIELANECCELTGRLKHRVKGCDAARSAIAKGTTAIALASVRSDGAYRLFQALTALMENVKPPESQALLSKAKRFIAQAEGLLLEHSDDAPFRAIAAAEMASEVAATALAQAIGEEMTLGPVLASIRRKRVVTTVAVVVCLVCSPWLWRKAQEIEAKQSRRAVLLEQSHLYTKVVGKFGPARVGELIGSTSGWLEVTEASIHFVCDGGGLKVLWFGLISSVTPAAYEGGEFGLAISGKNERPHEPRRILFESRSERDQAIKALTDTLDVWRGRFAEVL